MLLGKPTERYAGKIKTGMFDYAEIAAYFHHNKQGDSYSVLSDQTYSDLGVEDLFSFTDRTSSRVGQQYLYNLLRTIPVGKSEIEQHEDLIDQFSTNSNMREGLTKILSGLQSTDAYSIIKLLSTHHPATKGIYTGLLTALRFLPTLSILFYLLTHSALWAWCILITILVNGIIHYWYKPKCNEYLYSIPQLIQLLNIAQLLSKIPSIAKLATDIPTTLTALKEIKKAGLFLRIERKLQGDVAILAWFFTEVAHILFLLEPLSFIKFTTLLKNKEKEIETVYRFVGLTDCLLAVYFLRQTVTDYCLPQPARPGYRLEGTGIYHPLIPDCIANSLVIKEKSVLLNGSNMSGKTTFIRTIGLNILLAQTIHTVFATKFRFVSPIKIQSSLMLADSLLEGKSFYMREVDTIKEMLNESKKGETNLFLFDEIFKGTNTTERIAAAKAVLTYLGTPSNIIIASTHDTELSPLLEGQYHLYHFSEVIHNDTFSFDYKLKEGPLYQRNAIRLLEINHFPDELIQDAYQTILTVTSRS